MAIEAVRGKVMGLKRAVKQFGVPRSTLQRRCKTVGDIAVAVEKGLGRFRQFFSPTMELELVVHIKRIESRLLVSPVAIEESRIRLRRSKRHSA